MTHEFDGRKYEQASAHQKEWGAKLIADLDLQGTERVLDLGCGGGTLAARIADLVPAGEVLGIDASHGMIDEARLKSRNNLQFVLMDINKLNYIEQFDIVFSSATLHWIKDHRRLLRNVRRALRSGGRLSFNFAGDGNCSSFFSVVRGAMAAEEFSPCFAEFDWPWYMPSVHDYSALLATGEMHDGRVWGENADRYFPDAETMIKWIDQPSLVPFLEKVPEKQKAAFRDTVIQRMIEQTRQDDGRCFETFRRINVSAHK